MVINSALEQFLLLSDIAFQTISILLVKLIIHIGVILKIDSFVEAINFTPFVIDVFYFNELITRFNIINMAVFFTDLLDNIIFNLVNLQYYKLNFFLIFACLLWHVTLHQYFLKQFFS